MMIEIDIEKAFYPKNPSRAFSRSEVNVCLENVHISIEAGSCMVVIGESGSGKSTLLKTVCGLHKNYIGAVSVDGLPVSAKSVYYMPQKSALLPWMTVAQNIIALRKVKDDKVDMKKLDKLFVVLNIENLKNSYPARISGGEAQRASLASALFFEPDIMLMDEPFSALDEVTRAEMQEIFLDIRRMFSISTVFVTHSIEEALILGDRIAVLKKPPKSVSLTLENRFTRDSPEYYEQIKRLKEVIKDEKK